MFGIPYVKQPWVDAEIAKAAARDPFGHRLHLVLGLIWLVCVPGPMFLVQVAGAGLWAVSVFRAYYIHRTWRSFGCHSFLWLIALCVAWQALSTTWSPDPNAGWWEIHSNRWIWAMWLTWSIMQHRSAMIAALAAGFLAANASQVVHAAGLALDLPALTFNRTPDRNSGWWQPVVGGSMLVAALGLHLPVAIMGVGRPRLIGLICSAITIAGLIATGSRGAWIAAAMLIAIVLVIALVRAARTGDRLSLKRFAIGGAVLLAVLAVTLLFARGPITRRIEEGRREVIRAIESRDYSTFTGARILMLKTACDEVRAHPIRGVDTSPGLTPDRTASPAPSTATPTTCTCTSPRPPDSLA
jgi:hypothetical protein